MKITSVNFQQVFPLAPYVNVKLGVEADVGDEPLELVLANLKSLVETWFKQNYPHVGESVTYTNGGNAPAIETQIPETKVVKPKDQVQSMIDEIQTVTDHKTLATYEFISKKYPGIRPAYEKKLKELEESS